MTSRGACGRAHGATAAAAAVRARRSVRAFTPSAPLPSPAALPPVSPLFRPDPPRQRMRRIEVREGDEETAAESHSLLQHTPDPSRASSSPSAAAAAAAASSSLVVDHRRWRALAIGLGLLWLLSCAALGVVLMRPPPLPIRLPAPPPIQEKTFLHLPFELKSPEACETKPGGSGEGAAASAANPPSIIIPSAVALSCNCSVVASQLHAECAPLCVMVYYFPQWHPVPENNRQWGFGHTDWQLLTDLKRGSTDIQNFKDEDTYGRTGWMQQPGELGEYNLLSMDVRRKQGELLWSHGGHGFIYHIYWFQDVPLFADFFHHLLLDGYPSVPFFFDYATEDWSLLNMPFKLCDADTPLERVEALWAWMSPFMRDPRYMRVHNRPILSLYAWRGGWCIPLIQRLQSMAARDAAINGFSAIWAVRVLAHFDQGPNTPPLDPSPETDAAMEFLPNAVNIWGTREPALAIADRQRMYPVHWRGVPVNFDNRPRSKWSHKDGGYDLHPYHYEMHMRLEHETRKNQSGGERRRAMSRFGRLSGACVRWPRLCCLLFVFLRAVVRKSIEELHAPNMSNIIAVNAWNEWSEGAVLEPGRQLLSRMLVKMQRSLTTDYVGTFCVLVPMTVEGSHADSVAAFKPRLDRLIASLEAARKSLPGEAHQLRGGRTSLAVPTFSYDLLLFYVNSSSAIRDLDAIRTLMHQPAYRHIPLRFVDTPFPGSTVMDDPLRYQAHADALRAGVVPRQVFRYAMSQCKIRQEPDWMLMVDAARQANPQAIRALRGLPKAAAGKLDMPASHNDIKAFELEWPASKGGRAKDDGADGDAAAEQAADAAEAGEAPAPAGSLTVHKFDPLDIEWGLREPTVKMEGVADYVDPATAKIAMH